MASGVRRLHLNRQAAKKGHKLTSKKAKTILTHGEVKGHPLTSKQKKFFGAIAGGQKPYKS